MSIYRIYTKRIAYELRKQGFKFLGTDINENFPQYLVFLFEDTPELHKALERISNK
jgi:hypothetical protein